MNEHLQHLLAQTSRTFAIPILSAPRELRDMIGTAYLSMRAIDEIEDHPDLPAEIKCLLLHGIASALRESELDNLCAAKLVALLAAYQNQLPEVSLCLPLIAQSVPERSRIAVWQATACMAEEMADWVEVNWRIRNESDLDAYTFTVAGRVGLMLSCLWKLYDGTETDETEAVSFGRALQAVNIIRNREDDLERGVDFYPQDWNRAQMICYARRQLAAARRYTEKLAEGCAVRAFCIVPLNLAEATLDAIEEGREKLSREEVHYLLASERLNL